MNVTVTATITTSANVTATTATSVPSLSSTDDTTPTLEAAPVETMSSVEADQSAEITPIGGGNSSTGNSGSQTNGVGRLGEQ
ncbi:hypothetical protein BGZ96_010445 [Linnemannia gamsii]|uniref:Uncharacterized protein n=1 Tax=Linnemannia gamsii TaxID=64522 RepID=A0ABQ7JV03_9FUNG|nr:hypothetical protein BGZ96_010445 [Linnemannia gamsii]